MITELSKEQAIALFKTTCSSASGKMERMYVKQHSFHKDDKGLTILAFDSTFINEDVIRMRVNKIELYVEYIDSSFHNHKISESEFSELQKLYQTI